jgi:type I restriction enzyme S subunit
MAVVNHVQLSDAVAHNRFSAEFFDPRYVFTPAPGVEWVPIGRVLKKCEYGLSISMNSDGRGFPIFRMNEIDGCFALRPEKYANIPRSLFDAYALKENDVLFNRTNSFEFVGRTGLVKDQTDCTFASYLIRLVPDTGRLLPEFLTIYLNTRFGIGQIKRRAMRSINQANVSGSEVRKILIPLPKQAVQQEIANLVNAAFSKQRESLAKYDEAKQLLESELELDKLTFEKPVGYTTRLSKVTSSSRIDAGYFQIPFRQIDEHLDQYTTAQLHTLVDITKGIEVGSAAYQASGHPFLRVSNIKETGIEIGPSDKYISSALYSRLQDYRPQVGELLLTKDGSPGVAMSVDQDCDGIISSGIVRLKPKNSNVPNEYLALAINSSACRMQIERECSGALILHWKPASIRKLRIPILAEPIMRQIANLVIEAKSARRESVRLIEEAKARVEQLIEESVQP